jgi:peptidoglycan hydrolase-like protein with peptidoglycan-binding domain
MRFVTFSSLALCFLFISTTFLHAQTVSGNGYTLEQSFGALSGTLSGNGYSLTQSAQPLSGLFSVAQFNLSSALQSFSSTTTTVSSSTPSTPVSSGGSNGGGFYVLPPSVTGDYTSTTSSVISSSSPIISVSTCKTRVTFTAPIDITLSNNKSDVEKLERFLNEYENEKLPINGVYELRDVEAVKRWQEKYKNLILDPMRLKEPTGTVYTLSQRQIERQTTLPCGEKVVVNACPFFRTNLRFGDRGEDVRKVQQFLNIVQGERLPLSGVFGPLTRDAVRRFQRSNRVYVSTFIPISIATGNWYTTTRIKANETIGCDILR